MSIGSGEPVAPSRGFWFMRDIPTGMWLVFTLVAAFAQPGLPMPRWLLIHLLLLGAATHAIFVWSQYFSFALLRSRSTHAERRRQNTRLVLVNAGAVLVLIGVPNGVSPITLLGAGALIAAVLWHGANLYLRLRGSLSGRFGHTIYYYIAASVLLAIGAGLGATVAHFSVVGNFAFAHALLNVLGWIGITIAGTLVTLWPTILRTRADEFAARGATRALPWLVAGVLVAAVGAAFTWLPVLLAGLLGYLCGLGVVGISGWRAARNAPPRSFAALSVGAGFVWWIGVLVTLVIGVGAVLISDGNSIDGIRAVATLFNEVVPYLAAGFVAQVLLGALSYLIPVVLGGGPSPVKVGTATLNRASRLRICAVNAALFVTVLATLLGPVVPVTLSPIADAVRTFASVVFVIAMAVFLPLMVLSMRAQRLAKATA